MTSISYTCLLFTLLAGCCGGITTQSVPYPPLAAKDNPPISDAGPDVLIMLPANSVMLDGSGSYDDHSNITYQWRQISGEQLTLQGLHERVLFLMDLKPSDNRFSLTVTDTKGHMATSYVNVKIIPRECPDPFIVSGHQSPQHNGTYISGDRAQFMCEEGYRAPHTKAPVIHIECSEDGRWVNILDPTAPVPTCERSLSCPMPVIPHGYLLERMGGYVAGDQGPIQCKSGVLFGDRFIVCQHDGTWTTVDGSRLLPQCQVDSESCDPPEDLEDGTFNVLDGAQLVNGRVPNGVSVFYYCQDGYKLENENSNIARCQNGQWIRKPARCIETPTVTTPPETTSAPSSCTIAPVVAHARSSIYHTRSPPEESTLIAIYFCEDGYQITQDKTMRCQPSEGVWHGTLPRCAPNPLGCPVPPSIPNGQYSFYNERATVTGDMIEEGTQVYYFCHNGYKMKDKNVSLMLCMEGQWKGQIAECEKRTHCDPPMDIPNGNWIFNYLPYPDFRIGSQLIYECEDNYKAIGSTHIKCLPSGYWSDYAPKCLPKDEYCSEPGKIENGFHMCKPSTCNLYKVGTEVDYICSKDHEPRPNDVMAQTCLPGGRWSEAKPVCAPVLHTKPMEESGDGGLANSTLTVVTATTCSVLGLLMLVLALVILQRHRLRPTPPSNPAPPPYQVDAELPRHVVPASGDQHDRVALIQFADGVQIALPSYEEAIRPHHHTPAPSRLSSHRAASIRSGDYRPLPSIPPCLRQTSGAPSSGERDHHRNSIITTASSNTRDNLSLAFGSMDTVNVSDGTSTSITIGTYDSSNPSLAMSQRATAGSLASASSNNSLANEDAPLLERCSSTEPHPAHHDTSVNTPIDEEPDKE